MAGWNYNPFLPPKKESTHEQIMRKARKEGPPDVMEVLSKRRWVTTEEAEMHYVSTRLGLMEKEGFKFFYPGSPSEWDQNYLNSVLAHDLSLQMLRERQKWAADTNNSPLDMATALNVSEAEKEKARVLSRGMEDYFKRVEKAKAFHQAMSQKGSSEQNDS